MGGNPLSALIGLPFLTFLEWVAFWGGLTALCLGSFEIDQWWEKRKK